MRRAKDLARRLYADRRAATAVEYALILALIFLAVAGAIGSVGNVTGSMWNKVDTKVDGAM